MFDEEQADKWVERVYNQDAQYKYIGPYSEKGIDNLFMLQGKRDLHRKWWLAKRFSIYDAKFVTGPYKAQAILFKCNNNTPAEQKFTITAGTSMNYGYGINNNPRVVGVPLKKGESRTFTTSEVLNLGDPVRIYGAANISAVDLSSMIGYIAEIGVENVYDESLGTSLTTLILGNATEPNNLIKNISGLKQATKLEKLDVRNLKALKSLDLSNQLYLKELLASNSGIASILLAKGSPLSVLSLPSTVTSLTLDQHSMLSYSNITFDDIRTIKSINVKDCPSVSNNFDFIYNWFSTKTTASNECSLVMNNVAWNDIDTARLLSLKDLGTLKLKGRIKLVEVTPEQLSEIQEVFGNNVFDSSSELYIIAPPAVYLVGPTSLTEGSTGQYSCIVAGAELQSASFSIISGGSSSYMTLNSETGLLTTKDGAGGYTITVQLIARTKKEGETKVTTTTKTMTTKILYKTYPSSSDTTLLGDSKLGAETTYTIKHSATYTGDFNVEWTLTGFDGYAEITESSKTSCTIRRLQIVTTVISGTLSVKFTKVYNGSTLFTLTKSLQLVNEDIAVADAKIAKVFYDAGLCANSTYITKDEAALITADDIQPGTSSSTSIFNNLSGTNDFSGFQYFTSINIIKESMFASRSFSTLVLPNTITSIENYSYLRAHNLVLNEGLTSIKGNISAGKSGYEDPDSTSLVIPSTLTLGDKIYYASYGNSTVYGGNNLTTAPHLDSNTIKHLSVESTNLRAVVADYPLFIKKFVVGGDAGLPTTITAPSGGYFEDMSTTQNTILEEINPNVYKIINKVYYITIIINTNFTDQDPDFLITYTNQSNEEVQVTVKAGTHILPIKYATYVKVSGCTEIENYVTPGETSWYYTNTSCSNTFTKNYIEKTDIYIQHIDGTLYTTDDWTSGGYTNEDANGVAVVRPFSGSFVIAKEESSSGLAWGVYNKEITDIVTSSTSSVAVLDNDGAGNTPKIIEQCNGYTNNGVTGAPAAEYCASYTFPNGKTGYLGALGEWQAVYNNKTEINNMLSLIGGTTLKDMENYWTSTQYNSYYSWQFTRFGTNYHYSKDTDVLVKPFCQLSNNQNT